MTIKNPLTALVANTEGEIFELDGYAAVGMEGPLLIPLTQEQTLSIPYGSELMYLPHRRPVVYNLSSNQIETLVENPYAPSEPIFPVAAFNSPGYVLTYLTAYTEEVPSEFLPLFSYGAVGWHDSGFRTAVIQVDREPRQDLRQMKIQDVRTGVRSMRRQMPANRLRAHLEKCALEYGCPAGKNFFLGRYEAPLPTATHCNAECLGCLSKQATGEIHVSQQRIPFTPTPEEIAEIALTHIRKVKRAVVSFGQGCEGDPLMAAKVIKPAIRLIRSQTSAGTINMNTNASQPRIMEDLFKAGLDSIRVSMNSARETCYHAYFRPRGYDFSEVKESIKIAGNFGKFVALNYLNCPGFTDTPEESAALEMFLRDLPVKMIQWRNLNFDPVKYIRIMNGVAEHGRPLGMASLLRKIHSRFPEVRFGYFNPPKETF